MSYRENRERFCLTETAALNIGIYSCYRHRVLAFSFPDLFDRMCETCTLRKHLKDIQLAMGAYMEYFISFVTSSDDFMKMCMDEGYEKAYKDIAEPRIDREERRIGNKWVCAKDPYADELFTEWLTAAKVMQMLELEDEE